MVWALDGCAPSVKVSNCASALRLFFRADDSLTQFQRPRRKRTPDDDIIRRLLVLVLEQFKDSDWPPPLVAGGWSLLSSFFTGRPALVPVAMELDIFGIAIAQLHAIGGDGSWVVSWLVRVLLRMARVV